MVLPIQGFEVLLQLKQDPQQLMPPDTMEWAGSVRNESYHHHSDCCCLHSSQLWSLMAPGENALQIRPIFLRGKLVPGHKNNYIVCNLQKSANGLAVKCHILNLSYSSIITIACIHVACLPKRGKSTTCTSKKCLKCNIQLGLPKSFFFSQ